MFRQDAKPGDCLINRRKFILAGGAAITLAPSIATGQAVTRPQKPVLRIAFPDNAAPYSWQKNGQCLGLLPALSEALLDLSRNMIIECTVLPRKRAEVKLDRGDIDGFCTYPAGRIRDTAYITPTPLIQVDYGYLIYNRALSVTQNIASAKSFDDLKDFPFFAQRADVWQEENVPEFIQKRFETDPRRALTILLARNQAGFMILPRDQAIYLASEQQLTSKLGIQKVDFIPNNILPYHISIRQGHPNAADIVVALDSLLQHPDWPLKRDALISKFATL